MNPILLLAEGDVVLRSLYARFLTASGYEVVLAMDGPDCLHKVLDLNPHLLVLDLELSVGGASVLDCLREQPPATWVPVVLLATAGAAPPFSELSEPPVIECLAKPCSLAALHQSIRSALAQPSPVSRYHRERVSPEIFVG